MANKGQIVVLAYHEVLEDDLEAWTVVQRSDFLRQMQYLKANFHILPLEEALAVMRGERVVENDKPIAVITFDDGYAGVYQYALPIIQDLKMPVTVFVATAAVEQGISYWYDRIINALQGGILLNLDLVRFGVGSYQINHCKGAKNWREIQRLLEDLKRLDPTNREYATDEIIQEIQAQIGQNKVAVNAPLRQMSVAELKSLAASPYVTIGAHSHCHNILTQLSPAMAEESVRQSKHLLEAWTDHAVNCFSYPNGNYDDNLIGIVENAGFSCAVTTEHADWASDGGVFCIPRRSIGRYDSFSFFKAKVAGVL